MTEAVRLAELWRGGMLESEHRGHAVICGADGSIAEAWGDPAATIYPRSSCKMLQALPLVESGAAAAAGLTGSQLALACASHQGAAVHTEMVGRWLGDLGMTEDDLRCGAHMPSDEPARSALVRAAEAPRQVHNNCSGKHAGMLTMTRHLRAGPEYVDPAHPLQVAIRTAFEEVTGEPSPATGIDGCSAPNFATSVAGLARAMAFFATAADRDDPRSRGAASLGQAMAAHPVLVAGEGRACTALMRAAGAGVALKAGAEAVYVAILPRQRLGIALKILDGSGRAAEAAITALLIRAGVLDAEHPAARRYHRTVERNWRGLETGTFRAVL